MRKDFYFTNKEIRKEIWDLVINDVETWFHKSDLSPAWPLLLRGNDGVGKTEFLKELKNEILKKFNTSNLSVFYFDIDKKGYYILSFISNLKILLKVFLRNFAIWIRSFIGILLFVAFFLLIGFEHRELQPSYLYSIIPFSTLIIWIFIGYKKASEIYKEESGGRRLLFLLKRWGINLIGKGFSTSRVKRNWIFKEILRLISKKLKRIPTIVLWDDFDQHIEIETLEIFRKWWDKVEKAEKRLFLISTVSLSKEDSLYDDIRANFFHKRSMDLKLNRNIMNLFIWRYLNIDILKGDLPQLFYEEIYNIVRDNLKLLLNNVLPNLKKSIEVKDGIPYLKVSIDECLDSLDIGDKAVRDQYTKFKLSLRKKEDDELELKGKKVIEIILSLQELPNDGWVTKALIQGLLRKMGFDNSRIDQVIPLLEILGIKNYKFRYITTRYALKRLILEEELNATKAQLGLYYINKEDIINASFLLKKLSTEDIKNYKNASFWFSYCKSLGLIGVNEINEYRIFYVIFKRIYEQLRKIGIEKFENGYFYMAKEYLMGACRFVEGLLILPRREMPGREKIRFTREQITLLGQLSLIENFINPDPSTKIKIDEDTFNKILSFEEVITNRLSGEEKKRRKKELKKVLDEIKEVKLKLKVDIEFEKFIVGTDRIDSTDWIYNLLKLTEAIHAEGITLLKSTQNKDAIIGALMKLQLQRLYLLCAVKIGFTEMSYRYTKEVGRVLDEGLSFIKKHEAKISSAISSLNLYNYYYNLIFIALLSDEYDKAIDGIVSFARSVRSFTNFKDTNILEKAWIIYFKFIIDRLSHTLIYKNKFENSQAIKDFLRSSTPEPSEQRDKIEEKLDNQSISNNDALREFSDFLLKESHEFFNYSFLVFSRYSFFKPILMTPEVLVDTRSFMLDKIFFQYRFYNTRINLFFVLDEIYDPVFSLENGKSLLTIINYYIFKDFDLLAIYNKMTWLYGLLGENSEEGLKIAQEGLNIFDSLDVVTRKNLLSVEIDLKWYFAEFYRRIGFIPHLERGLEMLDSISTSNIDWHQKVSIKRLKAVILVEKYLKTDIKKRDPSILDMSAKMLNECINKCAPRVKEIEAKDEILSSLINQSIERIQLCR